MLICKRYIGVIVEKDLIVILWTGNQKCIPGCQKGSGSKLCRTATSLGSRILVETHKKLLVIQKKNCSSKAIIQNNSIVQTLLRFMCHSCHSCDVGPHHASLLFTKMFTKFATTQSSVFIIHWRLEKQIHLGGEPTPNLFVAFSPQKNGIGH